MELGTIGLLPGLCEKRQQAGNIKRKNWLYYRIIDRTCTLNQTKHVTVNAQARYRRNWIISACAHGVNSRPLYAYIRECAYKPDVSVMRADS